MRTDFDPAALGPRRFYALLTATIVPRPIAWVSTTSPDGTDNLAPHSFFTVACVDPPVVQFTSVGRKDTLRNVEATREFVVHLTPEDRFEQVNATGTNYPAHRSEFDATGLEREPSLRVRPPRVAASPVALEYVLHGTLCLGDSTVVLGRVVHAAVASDVLGDDGLPDVAKLAPVSRLGRNEWGTAGDVRRIDRIPYAGD
ncbi:flavin reductase family protein [Patulibacter sp. S7RM1-6]